MSLAVARPSVVSATMERANTAPIEPVKPIMKRAKISSSIFGAKPHATVAMKQTTAPISSGLRRPVLSDRGPTISWPSAIPTMNPLNVSEAFVLVVFRFSATAGSAARYMSVASGAIAVNSARTTIKMGDSPKEVLVDFEDICLSFSFCVMRVQRRLWLYKTWMRRYRPRDELAQAGSTTCSR